MFDFSTKAASLALFGAAMLAPLMLAAAIS